MVEPNAKCACPRRDAQDCADARHLTLADEIPFLFGETDEIPHAEPECECGCHYEDDDGEVSP